MKKILIIPCLLIACALHAQDKQTKTDTAALFERFKAVANTYDPIWALIAGKNGKAIYIEALQRGDGILTRTNKTPFPVDAIVFGFVGRKVEDKGKAVYNKEGK